MGMAGRKGKNQGRQALAPAWPPISLGGQGQIWVPPPIRVAHLWKKIWSLKPVPPALQAGSLLWTQHQGTWIWVAF
jgi:hypothetical protein